MSSGSDRSCVALVWACGVDHVKYPASAHTAFEFTVALEDRDEIQLEAEPVEIDPEEAYPQTFEIWAHFRGGLLELRADTDVRDLQERMHAFLQGLAPLAEMLAQAQGEGGSAIATDTVDFFGPEYTLKLPDGEQWLAQLFQSEDAQVPLWRPFTVQGFRWTWMPARPAPSPWNCGRWLMTQTGWRRGWTISWPGREPGRRPASAGCQRGWRSEASGEIPRSFRNDGGAPHSPYGLSAQEGRRRREIQRQRTRTARSDPVRRSAVQPYWRDGPQAPPRQHSAAASLQCLVTTCRKDRSSGTDLSSLVAKSGSRHTRIDTRRLEMHSDSSRSRGTADDDGRGVAAVSRAGRKDRERGDRCAGGRWRGRGGVTGCHVVWGGVLLGAWRLGVGWGVVPGGTVKNWR